MAVPTSGTASLAYATGAITITGSILGLEYQYLLIGMLGGLIRLSFFPQATRTRMVSSVAVSALLAGYATPVLGPISIHQIKWLDGVASESLHMLMALLVGLLAQTLVPMGMAWLRKFGGGPA